jgi:hypothetical protein
MITATLKTALTSAGCTLVLYESQQLANLLTDQTLHDDIVGLILQPVDITLEVKANAILEHYPPIRIEIMKQVRLEDSAENHEAALDAILAVAKSFIKNVILSGQFKKVISITVSKILETRYDANLIGWSLPLDLQLIENTPCD